MDKKVILIGIGVVAAIALAIWIPYGSNGYIQSLKEDKTAKLISQTKDLSSKVPLLDQTITLQPQEKRTYAFTTQAAKSVHISGVGQVSPVSGKITIASDNDKCSNPGVMCMVVSVEGTSQNNNILLPAYTNMAQRLIIQNPSNEVVTATLHLSLEYIKE